MSCPICGKATEQDIRPFCSKRCADLDLARWFNGSYAVPSQEIDDVADLEEALEKARQDKEPEKPH